MISPKSWLSRHSLVTRWSWGIYLLKLRVNYLKLREKKRGKRGTKREKSEKRVKKIAGCKENRALLDFSCIFSVAFLLEYYLKFNSASNATSFRTLAQILRELWPFSCDNFWKRNFFVYFFSKWPPLKSQIVKIDYVYVFCPKLWMFTYRKTPKSVCEYLIRYWKWWGLDTTF